MEIKKIFIKAGDIGVSREPCLFVTILGSCITVCLYDLKNCWGGMNHFMLIGRDKENPMDTRFSEPAIYMLIQKMKQLGSDPRELVAKVIGGGNVVEYITSEIGTNNAKAAFSELNKWKIPIFASDIGGKNRRKVHFYSHTGRVELEK